jgi:hypothetical protein
MLKNYIQLNRVIKRLFIQCFLLIIFLFANVSSDLYGQYYGDEMMELKSESLLNGTMDIYRATKTVIVISNTAYVSNDYGLVIFDVTDPANSVELGHIGVPSCSNRFIIQGQYAYVSCRKSGFAIVDIDDVSSLSIVNYTEVEDEVWDITVDGNIAYLAVPQGLVIYNVSDPSSPQFVQKFVFNYSRNHFPYTVTLPPASINDILYYNDGETLFTLDISTPTSPVVLQEDDFTGGGVTWDTPLFSNGYMYVPHNMALHVYDISNPASPQLVYAGLDCFPMTIYSAAINDDILILTHWQQGWGTVDISDPTNPQLIHYYSQTYGTGFGAATLEGNTLYLSNNQKGNYAGWRIRIIDITDPVNAVLLGEMEPNEEGFVSAHDIIEREMGLYAIVAQENYTNYYGAQSYAGFMRILYVTDPNNANLISTLEIPACGVAVAAEDDYAVVRGYKQATYGYKSYIYLIDISNLSAPYIAEEELLYGGWAYYFPHSLCLHNRVLYVVANGLLKIYEITGSTTLNEIGSIVINTNPNSVTVRAEGSKIYAYVTVSDAGFHIYDVTNPENIYLKSFYYNGGDYRDAHIQDDYAYAVLFDTTVQIIDITDNNCVPVNNFFVSGEYAWGITVESNLAFVNVSTNLDRYLNVIDIDDPINPIDLGTYRTSGNVQTTSLTDNGKYMYVSDYYDFSIYHPLFNFKPLPFSLLTPEDDTEFGINEDIDFSWEESEDANGDVISYTLNIWNMTWDTNIITEDTTAILSVNNLPDFGIYSWTVIASDGEYQQFANETFNFNYINNVGIGDLQPQNFERNRLLQNYPNPFDQLSIISYQLSVSGKVLLKVYDVMGNEVATLVDEQKQPGKYEVEFDGTNLPSGIYYFRLTMGKYSQMKKMLMIK